MHRWPDGSLVRVKNTFVQTDPGVTTSQVLGHDNIDPAVVYFMYSWAPIGASACNASATYRYGIGNEIQRDDVGRYHIDLDTTNSANSLRVRVIWEWEWRSTGTGQSVDTGLFEVYPTPFIT